jgi:hypothetical protein
LNRGGGEADSACNIVVGSYDLLTYFTRPSERPGHATATAAIRSKPIAPLVEAEGIEPSSQDNVSVGLYMLSRCFDLDSTADRQHPAMESSRLDLIR